MNYQVTLAAAYIIWEEKPKMPFIMELIQYIIVGIYYCLIFMVFIIKKKTIVSNYNFIQTIFIQWSNKRALHPNKAYKENIKTIKSLSIPLAILSLSIALGPLVSAINDIGKLPLGHRAHFVLFWPKVSYQKYYDFVYLFSCTRTEEHVIYILFR